MLRKRLARRLSGFLQHSFSLTYVGHAVAHDVNVSLDDHKEIVEIVSHTTRQPPIASIFVVVLLLFELPGLSDIRNQSVGV